MSLPASFVTMVGRAGPTIVWSSAPRNSPSRTAKRISIFARWGSPRAGSSSSVGGRPPCSAGKDSIGSASLYLGGWLGPAEWPLDVVGVDLQVVLTDLLADGATKVTDGTEEPGQLRDVELAEDRSHLVLLDRLDLVPHPRAFRRDANQDDPAVVRHPDPLDETPLLHPVDQAAGVAEGGVHEPRE